MQDANAYLELVHKRELMNEITRRYWKAACSETGTCSLGEGSRKSATVTWQLVGFLSYIEAAFGVQRRMADWSFEKAQTWEDLLAAHTKWLTDYNFQRHMAHEGRDDGSHSPAQVLNWQRGMQPEPELLYRTFSALGETRVLNKAGYAKFRNFLLYGEQGLAGRETLITIFQDTLVVEYEEYSLSKYSVEWQPDDRHLFRVGNPRLYQNPYQIPQLPLWEPGEVEWHVIIRCQQKTHRQRRVRRSFTIQIPLPLENDGTKGERR